MLRSLWPLSFLKKTPAAGAVTPVIRFTSGILLASGTTLVVSFSGASAGDRMIVWAVNAWGLTGTPSGWTQLNAASGAFAGGHTHTKVLDATDISTGSVTFNYAGSYGGKAVAVCMTGAPSVRAITALRYNSGSTSHTLSTDSSPVTGDLALLFGGNRDYSRTWANSGGTQLQLENSGFNGQDFSFGLFKKTVASSGVFSDTMTINTTTSAEYMSFVVVNQ